MKRMKGRKGTITTLPTRTDEHVAHEPSQGEPTSGTTTADPALVEAAQEVVDRKLAEAKAIFAPGTSAPEPRRVGPLRKIHMATLERAAALAQPLLDQLAQIRRQVRSINSQAIDDVLEDLGQPKRETTEDARVVEVEGETYVELSPVSARARPASPRPTALGGAPQAT